jgi:hypothetical protein
MTKVIFETGLGIMPGEPVEVEQEYLDRLREKHREADEADVFRLIELGAQQEANKPSAELQRVYDAIDANCAPHLKNELAKENASTRVRAQHKKDFARFQEVCAKWQFPALPASPQAVAVFLAEVEAAQISRFANSISVIHRSLNFSDPVGDVLVQAILRLARTECSQERKSDSKKGK